MRITLTIPLALLILTSSAGAQERLMTLSLYNTPTLIETEVSGLSLGPAASATVLPPHTLGVFRTDLVALSGGRFVAWKAQVGIHGMTECYELIALFDRRTRVPTVIPELTLPCEMTQITADRMRPRLFVHTFALPFSGLPGIVGVIDGSLRVRHLLVAPWLGKGFSYAPDADRFYVTRSPTAANEPFQVLAFDASTGLQVAAFDVPDFSEDVDSQIVATSDGSRVFVFDGGPIDGSPIRVFDVATGQQIAQSQVVDLGPSRLELDESRGLLLVPHRSYIPSQFADPRHLLVMNLNTLEFIGEANAGGYGEGRIFRLIKGRADTLGYLVRNPESGRCDTWADALDLVGNVRARVEVGQLAGIQSTRGYATCSAGAVLLTPPQVPGSLAATVDSRRVTLTWTNPGDTTHFLLDVGLVSNRTDLSIPVGSTTVVTFEDVPPGLYFVRMRAMNEVGTSEPSREVTVAVR